ncbi:mechanosensitive ion channel family protein [Rhizobium sp.]|jgi:moderate conductance mechanosensitive channel|uniref:mechanosensitive ion channel family protein n=1 Tax=Rhizobium sp. TaxID=391 RepID=UPI000E973848|nr:hypothetical protein [Rhizobium sp.]
MYDRVRTQVQDFMLIAFLATFVFLGIFSPSSYATDSAVTIHVNPDQNMSRIENSLEAAGAVGKPVLAIRDEKVDAAATSAQPNGVIMQNDMITAVSRGIQNTLLRAGSAALVGLYGLPTAFHHSWLALAREDANVAAISYSVLTSLLFGIAAACFFLLLFSRFVPDIKSNRSPLVKAWIAGLRLIGDLCALAAFWMITGSRIDQSFIGAPFAGDVAAGLVHIVVMTATLAAAGRLLFCDNGSSGPLLDIANARWHLAMTIGFGALSGFIETSLSLGDTSGLDPMTAQGWHLLGSTVLTIYKLVWLIKGQRDIAAVFAGRHPNGPMRAVGVATVYFYGLSAVFIWLLGFLVVGTSQNLIWASVAGMSQLVFLLMPKLGLGISTLFRHFGDHHAAEHGPGLFSVLLWAVRIPLAGACWILGLQFTISLWQLLLESVGMPPTNWLLHLRQFGIAIVISWFVCSFCWKYFEAVSPNKGVKLPGQDDDAVDETTSRLSTILPVVRNLVLGAVISVAILVTLSSLGVDIAPMIAGFGVLGLALSFGSQSLVKDVVSGIFFLAEDAFRIGEYIDTGKLKGTVEQISLRSVRLRHQNGPIHTVPFGQIAAVTNFSRDWGTVKFELRFDREADLETIRKVTKKVGLGLLEHPEFGSEFLIPLKMQGIQDITENSMVIRFKFTSRPGNPSIIKREGIKRLLEGYKAAGLNLASNAVVVRHGNNSNTDAAAASIVTPIAAAHISQ